MNIGSWLGLIGGSAMLIISIYTSGGQLITYWDLPSVACTVGGSFFALMIQYGLKDVVNVFKAMGRAFRTYTYPTDKTIDKLYEFSEKARREGILSLEEEMQDLDDKFLQQGLRLVVDGTDAQIIRDLMENELNQMNERHTNNLKMLNAWSILAPGFGMLGTVLGLIAMLKNLEDKSRIGPNMAVALVTTFYGSIMSNFLFTPMMGKLVIDDAAETKVMEMTIEGVLSIQAGDNPRILLMKLASYLPPAEKQAILERTKTD
jgi:chemotaxis protein MotA